MKTVRKMKWIGLFLVFILVFEISSLNVVQAAPSMSTHAQSSALIDVQSGRILFSEKGDTQRRIASLTKVMTAIVAIEYGDLSDQVKVSKRAAGREGSSIYLKLNEEMSLSNLLYGLMLRSGNDAAVAIAEHVGGSEAGFVFLMNKMAQTLGMKNTQFRNPHGLDEEGHYSSANDMAMLTAYALKNKIFAEIVKTKEKQAPNPYEKWNYSWRNKNKMLYMYDGADGVKTGYTKKALRCLISSATRNEQQLVAVTLNDGNDWIDHREMLNFGFKHFPHSVLATKQDAIVGTSYVYGQQFRYPLEAGELSKITAELEEVRTDSVHYALGERGRMNFYLNGKSIGGIPVYEVNSARFMLNYDGVSKETMLKFKKHSASEESLYKRILHMFSQS